MSSKENYSIKNVIIDKSNLPILEEKNILKEALEQMSKYKFGVCFCVKKDGKLSGILTDGDIRRKILKIQKPFSALLSDDLSNHINKKPKKLNLTKNYYPQLKLWKKIKFGIFQ